MGRMSGVCICYICWVVFIISLSFTLLTLSYVGTEPRFYIQKLYIPALNNSHSYNASNLNSSIIIDFKFKRVVPYVPLRYTDLNISLHYGSNTTFSVGHYVLPGFTPGKKMTTRRRAVVEASGMPWEDAFRKVSGGSAVVLTVRLVTRYQLKRCGEDSCYYTKGKVAAVSAEVAVDGSGVKVSKKAIGLH